MISEAIARLVERESLSQGMARKCLDEIVGGKASAVQAAAFLTGLRLKGESDAEIYAFAEYLREHAVRVNAPDDAVDVCGTGGDASNSFNVSTAAAFVVAACGVPVVKHGNRSVSSKCGSADVLEALGANILLGARQAEAVLGRAGITFLFAPIFHPALKAVAPVRRELGFRTIFNLLGPLLNPGRVKRQLLGVCEPELTEKLARALLRLGSRKALVVHCGGLDELALHAPCRITELSGGKIRTYEISCSDFGLSPAPARELAGGSASENAVILQEVLAGKNGPHTDVVLFNSGAALYAAGKVTGIANGITLARKAIDSGAARSTLKKFVEATREHAAPKN